MPDWSLRMPIFTTPSDAPSAKASPDSSANAAAATTIDLCKALLLLDNSIFPGLLQAQGGARKNPSFRIAGTRSSRSRWREDPGKRSTRMANGLAHILDGERNMSMTERTVSVALGLGLAAASVGRPNPVLGLAA